jgi:hypothetical protein
MTILNILIMLGEDGLGEPTGPVGIEPDNLFLLGAKCVAPDEDQADPLIKSVKVEQVDDDDITNEEIFTLDEAREEWRYCLQTFSDAGCEDDLDQIAFLETSGERLCSQNPVPTDLFRRGHSQVEQHSIISQGHQSKLDAFSACSISPKLTT